MRMISEYTEEDANDFGEGAGSMRDRRPSCLREKEFGWTNGEVRDMVRADDQVYSRREISRQDVSAGCEARCQLGRSGQTIAASPGWWPMINRRAARLTNRVWNATSSNICSSTRMFLSTKSSR